jgi:hypothetical protein
MNTAEPLPPGPIAFQDEIRIKKMKMYTYPGISQIPTDLIQTGEIISRAGVHKMIHSI